MSIFAKMKKARENKKGFTLVELIVVLVILAILAAILVPALLGWIDKAKEKQRVLDCRSIYMEVQSDAARQYADESITELAFDDTQKNDIIAKAGLTGTVTDFTWDVVDDTAHGKFTVDEMTVTFDGGDIYEMKNGMWEKQKAKNPTPTP